ncbi:hypothetical protein ONR57_15860 [Hoyosella sp. YIM 151337]|uniref:hypothetical protein n=1 Tax=Hoyosella sp. YIM 151337 TaxID=2992742 RepID=UPI00223571E3|nr:hypothetical protein [Hoyosella sp. YIM 151337]MCW4354783.1 hypothetical protein [Hoyosella sp. YIM 151337]
MRIIKILAAAGIGIAVGLGIVKLVKTRTGEFESETWHTLPFGGVASNNEGP